MTIEGSSFPLAVLEAWLSLRKEGAEAFRAMWFWVDQNEMDTDPNRSFFFFVVHDGKLMPDVFRFPDFPTSGFNPDFFELQLSTERPKEDPWDSHGPNQASLAYWYRRFYQETRYGQMLVLNPDEPPLFFYPEGRVNVAVAVSRLERAVTQLRMWLMVGSAIAAGVLLRMWLR
jgi:hypothetical protein